MTGIKLTSKTLGLPTQPFNKEIGINKMSNIEITRMIAKQQDLLDSRKHLLPDKGERLIKSIEKGKIVLKARDDIEDKFASDFAKLGVSESSMPVCGNRTFAAHKTKRSAPVPMLPILSFEEQKKALESCTIKLSEDVVDIKDSKEYRTPRNFTELDSDDSDSASDSDD